MQMTMRYAHLSPGYLSNEVSLLDDVGRIETPPDPPTAEKLARDHHLSQREETAIKDFVISVRSSETVGSGKSGGVTRFGSSKRAAARKK